MYFKRVVIFLFGFYSATAQNSELWLLNKNGGNEKFQIDWRTNPPTFNNFHMFAPDAKTPNFSISDSCGNILFYTDLFSIMDENLADTLLADSITGMITGINESGGIIKLPKSDSLYLIFRTNFAQFKNIDGSFIPFGLDSSIAYAVWSHNVSTGRQFLVSKQNKLSEFYSDQLTIIKHQNNEDFWLVGRDFNGDVLVWSIDSSGIESIPTIFESSPLRTNLPTSKYPTSDFYCSPSGRNIFYVHHDFNHIYLCVGEFDRQKGSFKEIRKIQMPSFGVNFEHVQEIRSFNYLEECSILYFVEHSNHNRLFKYQFDDKLNLIDTSIIYNSSDYSNEFLNEVNLDQMKLFRGKIYFTNGTYNQSIYEDSVRMKMSILELPMNCGGEEKFNLMGFETGGLKYRRGNSGKLPISIGGNYNDEKSIIIENICLGDTSLFKSYNTGCNPFIEWFIKEENENTGQLYPMAKLSHVFQTSGLHRVEYRTTADTLIKFVNIEPRLSSPINLDTFICGDKTIEIGNIGAEIGNTNFVWNNGKREMTIAVNDEGTYTQTAYNSCNSISSTWNVKSKPISVSGISDTIINSCNKKDISIEIPEGDWNIKWFDNIELNSRNFYESGKYNVDIFNQCFDTTFAFEINFELDSVVKYINVFTPNGDGYNDIFIPYSDEINEENFSLKIYNRWGIEVFATYDPKVFWDGRNIPSGDYFYSLSFQQCDNQKTIKGNVKVIK